MRDPTLYNQDLAPIPKERRTWGTYNYASLWVAMSVCIPTYMLASGLIAGGMSWWQAIGTILLGNLIVLVPMLLNAHAGARYGIPFPVFVRASFGVRGANIPAVLRPWWRAAGSGFRAGSEARPSSPCSGSSGPAPRRPPAANGSASSLSGC
jgi:cytosine/uracil/thiamine/allantoin permease